jgi:heptosyltransferase III
MTIEHLCQNAVAWVWGHLHPLTRISTPDLRKRLESGQIRKILLIRQQQNIGDLILATPVFRALQETYPSVELHFLGRRYNLPAVQNNPRLARIWTWNKKDMWNPWKFWYFFRSLRKEKFDLALIVYSNAPSLTSFLIAQASGAPITGSCKTAIFYGRTHWSRWLTHWEAPAFTEQTPEYQKFFTLVAPLVGISAPAPEYPIPQGITDWAENQWQKRGLSQNHPPIAFFLGGNPRLKHRLWLGSSWGKLAQLLKQNGDGPLIAICPPPGLRGGGGAAELNLYPEFREALGEDIPIFDEPGLPQAAAFLKPTRLFICLDGGLFHIAAASGVRTLGLFFGSDPDLWRPPLDNAFTLRAPEGRPDRLSPESVFQKVQQILQKSSSSVASSPPGR